MMRSVWVTRSEPGASRQAAALQAAGYPVLKQPVLIIKPVSATVPEGTFKLVIVVSEHGVRCAPASVWRLGARVVAVGRRTALALAKLGVVAEVPELASAEGLLQGPLAEEPLTGMRVLLVCGRSGRELLPDTLRERGALLTELIVYERVAAAKDRQRFPRGGTATIVLDSGKVGAIVAASGDGLAALAAWAPTLRRVPLLVPSRRVGEQGERLGFKPILECAGASNEAVLAELENHPLTRVLRHQAG